MQMMIIIKHKKFELGFIALASAMPILAQATLNERSRVCIATLDSGDGEWTASRYLSGHDSTARAPRDEFQFESGKPIAFEQSAYLKWELHYRGSAKDTGRKTIDDREISVYFTFRFEVSKEQGEPRKPDATQLHLYRSMDPNERRLGATSLSTEMWWDKSSDGSLSGKASIPLDHMLAFGQNFDQLAWDIQAAPDRAGYRQKLARGALPISAMRNRKAAISKLRKLLDKKAVHYEQECDFPITVTQ